MEAWCLFVCRWVWKPRTQDYFYVLVDETDLPNGWKALVASIPFRNRAIPIFWVVYEDEEIRNMTYKSHNTLWFIFPSLFTFIHKERLSVLTHITNSLRILPFLHLFVKWTSFLLFALVFTPGPVGAVLRRTIGVNLGVNLEFPYSRRLGRTALRRQTSVFQTHLKSNRMPDIPKNRVKPNFIPSELLALQLRRLGRAVKHQDTSSLYGTCRFSRPPLWKRDIAKPNEPNWARFDDV